MAYCVDAAGDMNCDNNYVRILILQVLLGLCRLNANYSFAGSMLWVSELRYKNAAIGATHIISCRNVLT